MKIGLENFISFTRKPPTAEDALLRFYTIQKDMQEKASRPSSQSKAVKQTVTEIEAWWIKAGLLCQSSNGLTTKLLKLVNEQKQLSQDHLKIQKKKEKNYTNISTKAKIIYAKIERNVLGSV